MSAASLWHRAPVLDAVKLVRPALLLARDRDDRYNVQDLVDRALARVRRGRRRDSRSTTSRSRTARSRSTTRSPTGSMRSPALDIAVPFVSSLPYETDIRVTPRMDGTFNGSRFALNGSTTPFAERREATLDIDLDALPLPTYVAYLPVKPRFDLAGGALTTRLKIVFVDGMPSERRLELRGDAQRGRSRDQASRRLARWSAAERIAVALDRILVFGRDARIASLSHRCAERRPEAARRRDARARAAAVRCRACVRVAATVNGDCRTCDRGAEGPPWTASLGKLAIAPRDDCARRRGVLVSFDADRRALDASNLTNEAW